MEFTHTDKVFWKKEGYTKGDLLDYYRRMAPFLLPYLKSRPENLNRSPGGAAAPSFYQKDMKGMVPPYAKSVKVRAKKSGKVDEYIVADNRDTLLYLVNLGCIEVNPWNARAGKLLNPDYLIFDLDPEGVPFSVVIAVAQEVRGVLERVGVPSYPKTSGKRGLHIYVPLAARYSQEAARTFSLLVAKTVEARLPKLASTVRNPKKRRGKVYIDCFRNAFGQTAAAPYSVRPFPGATVSTPLSWREVKKGLSPNAFTMKTIPARLKRRGDLWKPVLGKGADLVRASKRLKALSA